MPKPMTVTKVAIAGALLAVWTTASAQDRSPATVDLQRFANEFVAAIAEADWSSFRRFWAEDAVMYAPASTGSIRLEGLAALEREWRVQFDQMRDLAKKRGLTAAPFTTIAPRDLRIDQVAPSVGVVSFHLDDEGRIRRRMFVAVKSGSEWRVTHLHASNLPAEAKN